MTKRYLMVCGGTGRGLVDKRVQLGLDGLIQFDVANQLVPVRMDNQTLTFELANPGNPILFNTEAIVSKIDDLRRTRTSKINNLNLIRSSHGPLVAEYEKLSAAHATEIKQYEELKEVLDSLTTPAQERRAAETRLEAIQTAVESVLKMKRELSSSNVPYLTLQLEIDALEKKIDMYQFVLRGLPPASLADGMAQVPIVASSYFNRSIILEQMDQFFAMMTAQNGPVPNEPIEIYIISSMCGGTGQGISHHVGMRAAKYFRRTVPTASISVRFIRVGAWTHNKIGAALKLHTNTNAAMAILHDAGLAYGQQAQNGDFDDVNSTTANADLALADFQFFYIETPDFDVNKVLHFQYIEIACSAIMNDLLSMKFQMIMHPIRGFDWFKGVFVRVGCWANEVDVRATYAETLEQLRSKITRLVNPDYRNLIETLRYEINPNSALANWLTVRFVGQKVPSTIRNRLSSLKAGRHDEESIAEYIKSQDFLIKWGKMSDFLHEYVGMQDKHGYSYDFRVGPDHPQASLDLVAFDQQIASKYSVQYIHNVTRAHDVRAVSLRLLAGAGNEKSVVERLFSHWNAMVPGMFDGNKAVDAKVQDHINAFVETYFLVRMLISVVEKAEVLITDVRDSLAVMVEFIKKQQELMPAQAQVVLTSSAELTDLVDTKTWLASIHDSLIGNLQSSMVVHNFKAAVVWGSRGLTSHGLRHVMGIPQQASSQQVVAELNSRAGRIMVGNTPEEAKWWQGQSYNIGTPGQYDFSYRVLPPLPPEEMDVIMAANDEYAKNHGSAPQYIQAPNAFSGLKILSVECMRSQQQLVPILLGPLIESLKIRTEDRDVENHIRRLAASSTGLPIYLTDELNEIITGGQVDLRKYFDTVGD